MNHNIYSTPDADDSPAPETKRARGLFRFSLYLFLLANLFYGLIYIYLIATMASDIMEEPSGWFEFFRTPLYFVDIYAIILLLNLNPAGFKLIILTSIAYSLGALIIGFTISDYLMTAEGDGIMFLVTGLLLPYTDVVLFYFLGKQQQLFKSRST